MTCWRRKRKVSWEGWREIEIERARASEREQVNKHKHPETVSDSPWKQEGTARVWEVGGADSDAGSGEQGGGIWGFQSL